MKLCEYEGKELLRKYGIATPRHEIVHPDTREVSLPFPLVLKSQVPASDRRAKGGIVIVEHADDFADSVRELFAREIDGQLPEVLLAEEMIVAAHEYYLSFAYSTEHRAPVLALNREGGTGVHAATIATVDVFAGLTKERIAFICTQARIPQTPMLVAAMMALWKLFQEERVVLAEVNPFFVLADGRFVAGDAKIITDDAFVEVPERPFVALGGDIAVIASGGGASMLNIDTLMRMGGTPANYVEYSGNPKAGVVEELTMKVLAQPGLRGAWVVGGTANFTDIFETMTGFVAGLRWVIPKPTYPIVIRRDGPRQAEARAMLDEVAAKEGFNLHVFGSEISMAESATRLMQLMQK